MIYHNKHTVDALYMASLVNKMHLKKSMRKMIMSRAFIKAEIYFLCPCERTFRMISGMKGFNLNELSIFQGKAEIQESFSFYKVTCNTCHDQIFKRNWLSSYRLCSDT